MGKEKKGFFEILKTAPQTLEEAKEKTKATTLLVAIIFAVFVVLFCLLHIILGLLWAVASVVIIMCMRLKWNQKNKRNFCPNCGEKFDYDRCVSWEISNVERKHLTPNQNASGKQVVQKDVATVVFTCTCQSCGTEKEFSQKHDVTVWYDNGTYKEIDLNNVARQYFKL